MTGTLNTGAGTVCTAKVAAGVLYTSSVILSWTRAAKPAFSSAVRGRVDVSRNLRLGSKRVTWTRQNHGHTSHKSATKVLAT